MFFTIRIKLSYGHITLFFHTNDLGHNSTTIVQQSNCRNATNYWPKRCEHTGNYFRSRIRESSFGSRNNLLGIFFLKKEILGEILKRYFE